ncbi:MAG: hypothetical protein JW818_14735 [Pirellulales bacterium]|nr:hypothetical protein [Pirellulales bacterium]
MKYAVCAWLQFIAGLIVLGAYDYYVRWRDGWLDTGGSPTSDVVWFGVPIVLGMIGVPLLWRATAAFPRPWVRVIVVAIQIAVGFIVFFAANIWYVIETGVDCM